MKRALSILLMVVMVLAPCAVVHAASMKSMPHVLSPSDDSHSQAESHSQHVNCHSGQQDTSHSVCSGVCDTLQRVAEAGTPERSGTDFKAPYVALVLALNIVFCAQDDESFADINNRYVESFSDSKTVLRRTARLRL